MPPANKITVFTDNMVTSSVGVQSACPSLPAYTNIYGENYDDICPSHFTDIHRTKLEDNFSRKQKPDDIQLQIIAMECNLLYKDVRDWFKARRIKWMEELVSSEFMNCTTNTTYKHDTNNNNTTALHDRPTSSPSNISTSPSSNGVVHNRKHFSHNFLYNKNTNNVESKPSKKSLTNNSFAHSNNDGTT